MGKLPDEMSVRWYRFMKDQPCPICGGIESCDHTVKERRRESDIPDKDGDPRILLSFPHHRYPAI